MTYADYFVRPFVLTSSGRVDREQKATMLSGAIGVTTRDGLFGRTEGQSDRNLDILSDNQSL